jgi:hypothetical protein
MRFMWRDRSTTTPSVSDWPLVPVPPPRGPSRHAAEGRAVDHLREPHHIVGIAREHHRLRQALVDRVVGRQHHAAGVIGTYLTAKTTGLQGVEKLLVVAGQGGNG